LGGQLPQTAPPLDPPLSVGENINVLFPTFLLSKMLTEVRAGFKSIQLMQLHWAPRFWDPAL